MDKMVFVLMIVWEHCDDATIEAKFEVFGTKEEAIDAAKSYSDGQMRLEGGTVSGFDEYYGSGSEAIPYPRPLAMNGEPSYCSVVATKFRGSEYRTWRVVYGEEVR